MLTFFILALIVGGGVFVYVMDRTSVDRDPLSRVVERTNRRCPACTEFLPARKSDRDRHLERHVVQLDSSRTPCFTWQCERSCEPEMVWTNSYAAAMGLAMHFQKRHSVMPVAFD